MEGTSFILSGMLNERSKTFVVMLNTFEKVKIALFSKSDRFFLCFFFSVAKMESTGKYVRIPSGNGEDDDDCSFSEEEASDNESSEAGSAEQLDVLEDAGPIPSPVDFRTNVMEAEDVGATLVNNISTNAQDGSGGQASANHPASLETMNARFDFLQRTVADLAQVVRDKVMADQRPSLGDQRWSELPSSPEPTPNPPVRFDNIPPFPKTGKTSCMWEVFTRYLEKFEIAISLNGVTNSAQRAQLLYLALGDCRDLPL